MATSIRRPPTAPATTRAAPPRRAAAAPQAPTDAIDDSEEQAASPDDTVSPREQARALAQASQPVVAPRANVPAKATGGAMQTYDNSGADGGFDELDGEVGFGSFPMLVLDKGEFTCEEHTFSELAVIFCSTREKWFHKAEASNETRPMTYSYDGIHGMDGRPLEDHFAEWEEAGYDRSGFIKNKYREVAARVIDTGTDLDDRMVILSVSPTGIPKLAGYNTYLKSLGLDIRHVVTKLSRGAKQTNKKNGSTWYPWNFSFLGMVGEE